MQLCSEVQCAFRHLVQSNLIKCPCYCLLLIPIHLGSAEFTADAAPQPFIDYYTQAECSVNALLQIRFNFILILVHIRTIIWIPHSGNMIHTLGQWFWSIFLPSRSEWDMFVVAADHPDGSSIPQNWVMPDQPSDEAWASALHPAGSGWLCTCRRICKRTNICFVHLRSYVSK